MSNQKKGKKETWVETLKKNLLISEDFTEKISLSVIIPVYNCSEVIIPTLESLKKQQYAHLEVIVVDAGSTDKTLDIVNSYASLITRIYTAPMFNFPEMVNRGISLATHRYLTFLFPGSFYLSASMFKTFAAYIEEHNSPHVVYCGSIQRELKRKTKEIFNAFSIKTLKRGENPATLSACWFRNDLFTQFGKLNPHYKVRFAFEFYCRLALENKIEVVPIERFFVDFDYGVFSYGKVFRYGLETWRILFRYFGIFTALSWIFSQKK